MTIKDLLRAWEQAVDDATVKQQHGDELAGMLHVRAGLSVGKDQVETWAPKGTGCFCTMFGCKNFTPNEAFTCVCSDAYGCKV